MAHIFSDPMDSVTAIADLTYRWDAYTSSSSYMAILATGGRLGGPCINRTSSNQGMLSKMLPTPLAGVGQDAVICSVSVYLDNTPAVVRPVMSVYNIGPQAPTSGSGPWAVATETWITASIDTNNCISLYRTGTLMATATTPLPLTEWKRIEMRVANIDDVGATAEIRVNGETVISFTGDLYTAGAKTVYTVGYHTSTHWRLDDFLILDSSGSTMNGFLGDIVMETLRPTGPGTTTQSTATGAATPWQAVSEVAPNGNTSYTAINTVGNKDTYVFADSTATSATVHAVVAVTTMKTTGMSPRKVAPVARLSGTEADGTPRAVMIDMTTAYRAEQSIVPRPGGGNWTIAEVNAAEFGWKVTQ
ncbi:hypothetical protein KIKIMORA_03370 [Brevundimonas phage vB_BpoS-Kikimora]|uniref:Uncharacterized protein n=1 Tax=Brevundimonas phage vB_BpoS-Kikimora TaxID=2948601 RepID=A0A9E7MS74_9CAUD|nr:hypothetical protein KIKIMORA_03370 [Brevundimonas phage vB_BpoS-Kikimora]